MNQNAHGILISFGFVFLVLGASTAAGRIWSLQQETTRKLIHITLCNWVFIAFAFFTDTLYACIVPACFILVNYISHKKNLITAMERTGNASLGTVWYAVSLLLLTGVSFAAEKPYIAICGMMAMGYGDGLAALVGRRWGQNPSGGKSAAGTAAMLAATGTAVFLTCRAYLPQLALRAALACGLAAALLELWSPRGWDNLSVPLGTGGLVWLLAVSDGAFFGILLCLGVTGWILMIAWSHKTLTLGAFFAAYLLGISLYLLAGWTAYGALIAFFVLGSTVSRLGKAKKESAERLHKHKGARRVWQVAANGLPALIFSLLYRATSREMYLLAVFVCFAGAGADTCSSEIGMLSSRKPVSILTLRPVQPGLSGGITLLGLGGAALGSFLLSLFAIPHGASKVMLVFLGGIACSLLDSVMGASMQAKYHLPGGGLTERPLLDGIKLQPACGLAFVNNDAVNFLSILACGIFAAGLLA